MDLDGKLGILIVTLTALFLIYLDNSGKLYIAMGLIAGPAISDGSPATVDSAAITTPAATGGIAPYSPVQVQPLGGGLTTIQGINGAVHPIPGVGSKAGGVVVPYAPPLPGALRRN